MQSSTDSDVERLSFDGFYELLARQWKQGEHVCLIGPTGRGKTTLASHILQIRSYVVVIAVKRNDETLDKFKKLGYPVLSKWPPHAGVHRVVLWIKPKSIGEIAEQETRIHAALSELYIEGGWCIFLDEAGYIAGFLHQAKEVGVLLNQGRSSHISMVCAMTRPRSAVASIPIETISMCRHVILFRYSDKREIEVCAKIAGIGTQDMVRHMANLGRFDFLYVYEGNVWRIDNAHPRRRT